MIIETSGNQLYRVKETGDADLAHVWLGIEVKKVRGAYVPKARARKTLVRKAATRIVDAGAAA
ncbi:MAG: hypothetical protein ABSC06_20110 [Rhodopila sp.]|jgi:hypothetical protein